MPYGSFRIRSSKTNDIKVIKFLQKLLRDKLLAFIKGFDRLDQLLLTDHKKLSITKKPVCEASYG